MPKHSSYTTDLSRLLDGICPVPAVLDTRIHGIQIDSRLVRTGDLFVALSGENHSAQDHLQEAIERGANAVLVEGNVLNGKVHESGEAIELYLPNLRKVVGQLASRFFQQPSKELKVIGVTGTNGKTSVSHYIAQLLNLNGMKTGVIGTLGVGFPILDESLTDLERTTPNVIDVHRHLAELRDQGAACVAMEVSSHGLEQGRVDEVNFTGAVFTNLTRDHLDYHGTMEAYGKAKLKLFMQQALEFVVINRDDNFSGAIRKTLAKDVALFEYGLKPLAAEQSASLVGAKILPASFGIRAQVTIPEGEFELNCDLLGEFNLYNVLASVGVCLGLGGNLEDCEHASKIKAVKGRMELFRKEGYPVVIVDYAHTPDALENLLSSLRPYCHGRLHLMFGCGGDRDGGKRSEMAKVAEAMADHVIVTDDNPRTEDPAEIVADIMKGFESVKEVEVIHGREKAIQQLISNARTDDFVVLAGKGHECYQEINQEKIAFSDLAVARKVMGEVTDAGSEGAVCD